MHAGSDAARVPFLVTEEEQAEDPFRAITPTSALEESESFQHTPQPLELENDEIGSDGRTIMNGQAIELTVSSTAERLDQAQTLFDKTGISSTAVSPHSAVSLLVLVVSCIAAFLALACIVLGLYVTKYLVSRMLASEKAWDLLPRFRKSATTPYSDDHAFEYEKSSVTGTLPLLPGVTQPRSCTTEKCGLQVAEENAAFSDAMSDIDSDDDTEKYQDALDMTPLPTIYDLPPENTGVFMDPPLPEIQRPSVSLPRFQGSRSPPMSEVASTDPPRPLWSIRASASPPLGLTSSQAGFDPAPQPIEDVRRRAYRSVPELDIALAMQLRPGLGLGADSAWMVRFLMSIFGWFAVALSGQRQ